jgi:replicative DNA helicase
MKNESERAVIGSILIDQHKSLYICQKYGIKPDCFTEPLCRQAFVVIQDIAARPKGCCDVMTVGKALADSGFKMEEHALEHIVDGTPTASHCEYYAGLIKEAYIKREAVNVMRKHKAVIDTEPEKKASDILNAMVAEITELSSAGRLRINKASDFMDAKLKQWHESRNRGFVGIPSCFCGVNKYLGGFRRGVMCIIGAYRGTGKSTLLRQEAVHMAQEGYSVALFSLEDPADMAAAGMAGNISDVCVYYCDIGEAEDHQLEKIAAAWKGMESLPLFIVQNANTMTEIINACNYVKQVKGLDAIFIDHIQYISPQQLPHMNRTGTMAMYSQQLSDLAKNMDATIIVASQFSRDCEREKRIPRLSDLRDSGTLEADARQVLLLYEDIDSGVFHLDVAKNNYGISGKTVELIRLDGKQRFQERV